MTDITDEQRAAYSEVVAESLTFAAAWSMIAPLLPSELTNPQPVLPTQPGLYASASYGANYAWRFDDEDNWWIEGRWVDPKVAATNTPFIRLVPERPQITRQQVAHIVHLGTNGTQVIDDLLALVNGTDRD